MRGKPKRPVGTTPRPERFVYPPDIFWISPDGAVVEVIGHLTAIQAQPETFGLAAAPRTRAEIDESFRELFEGGWVRGRYSDGAFDIQLDRPRGGPLGNAYDLVARFARFAQRVNVDFADPRFARAAKEMAAAEFLEQRFPLSWGLNARRRR